MEHGFFQLKMVQNSHRFSPPGSHLVAIVSPQGWLNAFGVALGVLGAPLDAVAPLGFGVFFKGHLSSGQNPCWLMISWGTILPNILGTMIIQ